MKITIKEYTKYEKEEILNLYESVGWTNYTNNPDMLEKAYVNSLKILGAYEEDKLVGVIRVVGDGYSIIYIQDILIFPEYQRKGIGRQLMNEVMSEYEGVYQKILLTDNSPKTIAFYKSFGFQMSSDMECVAFLHITI